MFQSTHSLRSATDKTRRWIQAQMVSIHALLAECDTPAVKLLMHFAGFNPRTPCGVRPPQNHQSQLSSEFQSTHSLRSATPGNYPRLASVPCFNPRTPCGVRPRSTSSTPHPELFQSTHSLRSATGEVAKVFPQLTCFNPRTPCGVRLRHLPASGKVGQFQSTHSLRSATY